MKLPKINIAVFRFRHNDWFIRWPMFDNWKSSRSNKRYITLTLFFPKRVITIEATLEAQ